MDKNNKVCEDNRWGRDRMENERTVRCPFCGGEMKMMH